MLSPPRSTRILLPFTNWFCVNRSASVSCIGIGNASLLCSPLDLRSHRKGIVLEELQQLCVLKNVTDCRGNIKGANVLDKKGVLLNESSETLPMRRPAQNHIELFLLPPPPSCQQSQRWFCGQVEICTFQHATLPSSFEGLPWEEIVTELLQ